MSRVEVESFVKSFLLFFISLGILLAILFYINYTKEITTIDNEIFSKMKVCSYDLKCDEFDIEFVEKKKQELYTVYKKDAGIQAYFPISQADLFIIEMRFNELDYDELMKDLKSEVLLKFGAVMFVVLVLSILFSFYAISPLRNALLLTQEFIKDILHDFNTPLASIRLNTSMLKKDEQNKNKIIRIEQSVQNVLDLQENLRSYLYNHEMQSELFDIKELINERIQNIQRTYGDINFELDMDATHVQINKDGYTRIIDNLLTNAAKYNKENGFVKVTYDNDKDTLYIKDSGKGIKNPSKIFQRFYKEQDRGIGIGLHIVKKLCDELNIDIKVKSELGVGSSFALTLR